MFEIEKSAKSIYKTIQVKIYGKIYDAKEMTRPLLRKIGELDKRIKRGEVDLAFDQLELMMGKHKVIEELELRQINDLVEYIAVENYKAERASKKDDPKNASGPGGKS